MEQRIEVLPGIGTVSRISWGSVFAGTIIALVVQFTLLMLGFAIGFGTIEPAVQGGALSGFGIGAAIWWIICSIIALFAGGWVASRLAGLQRVFDGVLHGLVTWGLVTLITAYLLTSGIGAVLGGAFGVVKGAIGMSGQAAAQVLPQVIGGITSGQGGGSLEQQIIQGLAQGGAGKGAQSQNVINQIRTDVPKILNGTFTMADRENLVNVIMKNGNVSKPQAEEMVQNVVNMVQQAPAQLQQAQQTAQQVASGAAKALTAAAIVSFIMLLLTGAAAGLGGWIGRVSGPVNV